MPIKRVQKLLFSEYCDFEDMVLIESPFAQTTRDGRGLRQVHLGVTPSKLILATDVLPPVERSTYHFLPGVDPAIETFELIAIYPIECVNLSVYRRRKRQAIKAHFCNNRVFYFELGGSFGERNAQVRKWTDRYLYLGEAFEDPPGNYKPVMSFPRPSQFFKRKQNFGVSTTTYLQNEFQIGDCYSISNFGAGEGEKRLFLPAENYIVPRQFSVSDQSSDYLSGDCEHPRLDFAAIAENCVKLWETQTSPCRKRARHRRRYGFAPQPLFLHGLGPWNVNPGCKYSIQVKRAVSVVSIRRQPKEAELRLPVAKRQLIATISCETVNMDKRIKNQTGSCCSRRPVIFFWTPDYWYRPRTAREAYIELQNHLTKIKTYQERKKRRRMFKRRPLPKNESSDSDSDSTRSKPRIKSSRRRCRGSVLGKSMNISNKGTFKVAMANVVLCCMTLTDANKESKESSVQYLKKLLEIDVVLTAWDFNSSMMAQQLTLIDRDLFLKISPIELGVLMDQQSSKNAPNIGAIVAFSHRISCLVATDILKNQCERMRARLIARFINVAYKCHCISNFQSCRTVLFGLQTPGIFRLKSTWAYVRKKHATKYEIFEGLCRLYRDSRLLTYQKAFFVSSQDSPYLPFIGDLVAKLLGRIPKYKMASRTARPVNESKEEPTKTESFLMKLLTSMKLLNNERPVEPPQKDSVLMGLCDYYKPLQCYEDNRKESLMEATEFLQQCQLSALHYSYVTNRVAMDYLLKARYQEERENFFQSLRIENVECTKRQLCNT